MFENASLAPSVGRDDERKDLIRIGGQRSLRTQCYGSRLVSLPTWLEELEIKLKGNIPIEKCIDHVRVRGDVFISEPYSIDMDDMRTLIDFCDEHGLHFTIDGDAAWYPGRTFRITLGKPKTHADK